MNTALQSLDAISEARGIILSVDPSAQPEPVYRDALLGLQTILYGLHTQDASFTRNYLREFLYKFAAAIGESEGSPWNTVDQMDEGEFFVKMLATIKKLLSPFGEKLARFKEIFETYTMDQLDEETPKFMSSEVFFLPGIDPNVASFETAMKAFTATETVDRNVAGSAKKSEKRIQFGCISPIFSTYITRFSGPTATKDAKRISFPATINVGPYMAINPPLAGSPACMKRADNVAAVNMELFFIVMHRGRTIASGHYIGYLKTGGQWIRFDDDDVQVVGADAIEGLFEGNDTAMMLHYVRTDAKDTVLKENFTISPEVKARLDAEIVKATSKPPAAASPLVIPEGGAPSTPADVSTKKRSFWDMFRWGKSLDNAANSQIALSMSVLLGAVALLSLCVV